MKNKKNSKALNRVSGGKTNINFGKDTTMQDAYFDDSENTTVTKSGEVKYNLKKREFMNTIGIKL